MRICRMDDKRLLNATDAQMKQVAAKLSSWFMQDWSICIEEAIKTVMDDDQK